MWLDLRPRVDLTRCFFKNPGEAPVLLVKHLKVCSPLVFSTLVTVTTSAVVSKLTFYFKAGIWVEELVLLGPWDPDLPRAPGLATINK